MTGRSLAQKRGNHALSKIEEVLAGGRAERYGNYRSYVNALPAAIITNGLGQALAMEKAGGEKGKKYIGHKFLYDHLDDWLRHGWQHSPYHNDKDVLFGIVAKDEASYLAAQAEAMAYLDWLKKFANAMLARDKDESDGR